MVREQYIFTQRPCLDHCLLICFGFYYPIIYTGSYWYLRHSNISSNGFGNYCIVRYSYGYPSFLGKSFSENDHVDASRIAKLSVLIVCIGTALCSSIVFAIRDWVYSDLSTEMIILSLLLLTSIAIATLLRSIIVATLNVKILPICTIVSSVLMIAIAVSLVLLDVGAGGVVIAYICFHTLFSVLLCFSLTKFFDYHINHNCSHNSNYNDYKRQSSFTDTTRKILRASPPSWIPALITIIRSGEVGTIAVFGSVGPSQAGAYFLVYTIFSALAAITYSIFSIAFPMLSGMHERREEVLWKFLKNNLILSLPISSVLIFYADNIMILFGRDYTLGADSLQIFLVSILKIHDFIII